MELGASLLGTLVIVGLISLAVWAKERMEKKPPYNKAAYVVQKWEGPRPGFRFRHCDTALTVVGHGMVRHGGWAEGALCNYRDDQGRLHEWFFTKQQWDALDYMKGAQ